MWLGRGQGSRPEGKCAAQHGEGVKVGATIVQLSSGPLHQPSLALGGHNSENNVAFRSRVTSRMAR